MANWPAVIPVTRLMDLKPVIWSVAGAVKSLASTITTTSLNVLSTVLLLTSVDPLTNCRAFKVAVPFIRAFALIRALAFTS